MGYASKDEDDEGKKRTGEKKVSAPSSA